MVSYQSYEERLWREVERRWPEIKRINAEWARQRAAAESEEYAMADMHLEIEAAVAWWKDILREHSKRPTPLIGEEQPTLKEEQLDAFAAALTTRLEQYFQEHTFCQLFVDYYPVPELAEAAKSAGMDPDIVFPWKTEMNILQGEITVFVGYGKPYKLDFMAQAESEG